MKTVDATPSRAAATAASDSPGFGPRGDALRRDRHDGEEVGRFVAEHGSLPTAESWTEEAMRPPEKTIRRRFGSFREAIRRAALT
jgi:hypothetical protein